MLHAKSLPQRLWVEELNFSTYIQNISPHRYVKENTPYEVWSVSVSWKLAKETYLYSLI
jgi:hypothetical protein